jgi:methyltransferase family protein
MASSDGGPTDRVLESLLGDFALGAQRDGTEGARDCYPVDRLADLAASIDAANYFSERMARAKPHGDKFNLLGEAFGARACDGLVVEFGVFEGATINFIAGLTRETVYGFDSFSGLPEDWRPGFPKGMFSVGLPRVRPNVSLVAGLFEDTLPAFLERNRQDVSFLHIDCDLYSSTRTVLRLCGPRIRKGTVLAFDEYFNYPGWRRHEFRAFQEFVAETGRAYEYLSVVPRHQQAAVIITR